MVKRTCVVFASYGLLAFLAAPRVVAHHSFAAEFDPDKVVTVTGTVVKMEWINPHAWLYVEAPGPEGNVVTWAVEFGAPNTLFRRGWRKTDLPYGARVTVQGYAARDGSAKLAAGNVTLPDGRTLFAGTAAAPNTPK